MIFIDWSIKHSEYKRIYYGYGISEFLYYLPCPNGHVIIFNVFGIVISFRFRIQNCKNSKFFFSFLMTTIVIRYQIKIPE